MASFTLFLTCLLTGNMLYYRKEPEIVAVNWEFSILFIFWSFMVCTSRIWAITKPINPDEHFYSFYTFFQCIANQCTLIGFIVIRQYAFYDIYVNHRLKNSIAKVFYK
eukprot:Pgem_evm3s3004